MLFIGTELAFKVVERITNNLMQSKQCDEVGNDHQPVKKVRKRLDKVDLEGGTDHDEDANDDAVRENAFLVKEKAHVLLAKEVPADNGGIGKEE